MPPSRPQIDRLQKKKHSEVFKVPESPPLCVGRSQGLAEIEAEMETAKNSRTLTKIDLSILASLNQAKILQKELDGVQRGKVINT